MKTFTKKNCTHPKTEKKERNTNSKLKSQHF